jgi:hypothetical protein
MDPALAARYGLLPPPNQAVPATKAGLPRSRGKQQIENKLNQIVLSDVLYDGLPLSEVIRDLNDQVCRRDPDKRGINILISNLVAGQAQINTIDPTTGQPLAPTTTDCGSIVIRLHLRDVLLKDVLDAMTKVADQPVHYSVEDYGVVFAPGAGGAPAFAAASASRSADQLRLQVRTFRVDTNTFLAGLENAFGISVSGDSQAGNAGSARSIQQGLHQLFPQLGINMDVANKAVFYNDLTGVLMVRATSDDLELVQAAVETLGGKALRQVEVARETQKF